MLAIASGKGGVGKSSVTVNLAAALAAHGLHVVGVLDADIWGFSVPRLLGISERMEAERVDGLRQAQDHPQRARWSATACSKVVSTGFLVDEETALMWRGLMLTKAVEQFLRDVHWGELDYLLIDMPPGTGDVQMGLARLLPRTDLVIVTTPALAAQKVAQRAADMARRSFLRVVGVIENMSSVHVRPRRRRTRCSARAAGRRWPTRSVRRCSVRCRSNRRCPPAATPALRSRSTATAPRPTCSARSRRGSSPRSLRRRPAPRSTWRAARRAMLDAVEVALGPKR